MTNINTSENRSQNLQTPQTTIRNISTKNISKIASMPDENLYNLCKEYGERTRTWRQRFAGLLPEVFKRKLYEKKGFISIFEFSKKLAGMSEDQTRLVLNLEKRFSDTPALKNLLTSGKVSMNKLSRIVSIAKPENEIFLATQVQILSKSAVETLVRDEKFVEKNCERNDGKNVENFTTTTMDFLSQNSLQESFFDSKSLPGQEQNDMKNTKSNSDKNTLNLSQEVQQKLLELQQKGINVNELLKEFLQKREEKIAQKKEKIIQEISKRELEKSQIYSSRKSSANFSQNISAKPITRHIPISIKRIIYAEHGTKCSIKSCQKSSTQIHHMQRFSAVRSHDPRYLTQLCKDHHELMHSINNTFSADMAYREIRQRGYK